MKRHAACLGTSLALWVLIAGWGAAEDQPARPSLIPPAAAASGTPAPAEDPTAPAAATPTPATPTPAPATQPTPTPAPGELLKQAYDLSQRVTSIEDASRVIELCRQAHESDRANPAAKKYAQDLLAWGHNKRGELRAADPAQAEAALADFDAAVNLDSTKSLYRHNRGVSHGEQGDLEAALQDFDAVVAASPDFAKGWFNRGEVRTALERFREAIEDYNQAIRRNSNDALAYNARGYAYYRLGDYNQAFSDYQRAIALDGSLTDAYINRGDMYADRAQFDQAVRDYQRALELNPVNPRVYLSAAWLRATAPRPGYQDAAKAERLAQKGIELGGETPRGLDVYAAALARGGRFEDATRTQQRAIELGGEHGLPEKDLERYRFRLSRYQQQKAYVDVAPTTPQPD